MKVTYNKLKAKKFVGKLVRICLTCGSEKVSSNMYTILCKAYGRIDFYEVIDRFAPLDEKIREQEVKQ